MIKYIIIPAAVQISPNFIVGLQYICYIHQKIYTENLILCYYFTDKQKNKQKRSFPYDKYNTRYEVSSIIN